MPQQHWQEHGLANPPCVAVVPQSSSPTKKCFRCKCEKPLNEFSRAKKSRDGRRSWCKSCETEARRGYSAVLRQRAIIAVPETKRCPRCGCAKDSDLFYRNRSNPDGLDDVCKECHRTSAKRYCTEHRDRRRNTRLKERYGITLDDYDRLFSRQKGVCAICDNAVEGGLCVDHCHKTGRVRGLLCDRCNRLLGSAGDNVSILRSAIRYLEDDE